MASAGSLCGRSGKADVIFFNRLIVSDRLWSVMIATRCRWLSLQADEARHDLSSLDDCASPMMALVSWLEAICYCSTSCVG
jgi:hypothetical protein